MPRVVVRSVFVFAALLLDAAAGSSLPDRPPGGSRPPDGRRPKAAVGRTISQILEGMMARLPGEDDAVPKEMMMQRTKPSPRDNKCGRDEHGVAREPASKRLTSLADPNVEWTRVAEGFGVPSTRAECPEGFARAFKQALERDGPTLIEAILA